MRGDQVAAADDEADPDPGPALVALYDEALPHVYGYLLSRCGGQAPSPRT